MALSEGLFGGEGWMARKVRLCAEVHKHLTFVQYTRRWWGKKRYELYCVYCDLIIQEPK